jgi:hypothetical protein
MPQLDSQDDRKLPPDRIDDADDRKMQGRQAEIDDEDEDAIELDEDDVEEINLDDLDAMEGPDA